MTYNALWNNCWRKSWWISTAHFSVQAKKINHNYFFGCMSLGYVSIWLLLLITHLFPQQFLPRWQLSQTAAVWAAPGPVPRVDCWSQYCVEWLEAPLGRVDLTQFLNQDQSRSAQVARTHPRRDLINFARTLASTMWLSLRSPRRNIKHSWSSRLAITQVRLKRRVSAHFLGRDILTNIQPTMSASIMEPTIHCIITSSTPSWQTEDTLTMGLLLMAPRGLVLPMLGTLSAWRG